MCCFFLGLFALGPRFGVLFVWIFGNRVEAAFDSWVWPLLGLIFFPWTTLCYLIVWSPIGGVEGAEWILVGLGVFLDIASYAARPVSSRYGRPAY